MVSSSKAESASNGENSSGDEPVTNSKSLFSEGEKVLAYHGPRVYEAKVQKAEFRKNEWRYFVHYLGWNKNWDEWVGTDRLMKHTEENILKQQALDKKAGVDKSTKSGRSAQAKPKNSADAKVDKEEAKNITAKGKKRKADSGIEDNPSSEKLIKIQIPPNLKKQLVDDWEFITQQNKLVKLPRSPNVDDILTKYLEYRSKKDGMTTDAVVEILNGLRCYFDKALPAILLYKKERQQYREAVRDNVSPSSIYGAEHLLRLFVKLPELLAYVKIEEETLIRLQQKLTEFLKLVGLAFIFQQTALCSHSWEWDNIPSEIRMIFCPPASYTIICGYDWCRFLQNNQSTLFVAAYNGPRVAEGGGKGKDN